MKSIVVAVVTATLMGGAAEAAVVVSAPTSTSAFLPGSSTAGARYRNLSSGAGQEHFLGRNDLGVAANRIGADLTYQNGNNNFSFSLSGGTLTSVMNGNSLSIANLFDFVGGADQPYDTLQITLRDGALNAGKLRLNNLTISGTDYYGVAVNNVSLADITGVDNGGIQNFAVTGVDFTKNFIFAGKFNRTGTFSGSQELNSFGLAIGNGPIEQPTVPEPATWAMLITGFGLVGAAMRRQRSIQA